MNSRKGRPFRFFTEAGINMADDEELLRMMREAGFISVFIGIETPDEDGLKSARKLKNTKRDMLESVRHIQSYGIEVPASVLENCQLYSIPVVLLPHPGYCNNNATP